MISLQLVKSTSLFGIKQQKSNVIKLYGNVYRNFKTSTRSDSFARRSLRSKVVQESSSFVETQTATPIKIGQAVLAGACALGLGSLAYYGLGLSNQVGILDRSSVWPQHIRERISSTYGYFGSGLGLTALAAAATARSPALMSVVSSSRLLYIFGSFAAVIASGMLVRSIPYDKNKFGSKQLAWAFHAGLLGAFIAPITLLGGPTILRAAWYTAGIVGGLSVIAATAPSQKFLNMNGPLAIGLGGVFAASVGSMFLPPTTKLGLSLYSITIYGGLVLFSMFLLYDTQKIVYKAENSLYFDPVNESISIYMDTLNIFIRVATILAGGNRRK